MKATYNINNIVRVQKFVDIPAYGYEIKTKKWYRKGGVYLFGDYICKIEDFNHKQEYYDKESNNIIYKPHVVIYTTNDSYFKWFEDIQSMTLFYNDIVSKIKNKIEF